MTSTPCPLPCAELCTESGFATAYAEHRPRLLAKAMAVVGDRQHAEDAVQDAFLRAWSKCSSFDPVGPPLAAWLTTITRNIAIDHERARAVRPRVVREQPPGIEPIDDRPGPDGVVMRHVLVQALARVSPDHRAVVLRAVLADRSYADIAEELGVPVGTVKSRVFNALRGLRGALDNAAA
ncbi:MAG: RNA polymerase sigma factor [Pseudonocardiales bacterium]|nr:RNA polymerase sigma factor [Pseudonocardiales bacterium]